MGKCQKYCLNNNFIEILSKSVESMNVFKVSKVTLYFNNDSKKCFTASELLLSLKLNSTKTYV